MVNHRTSTVGGVCTTARLGSRPIHQMGLPEDDIIAIRRCDPGGRSSIEGSDAVKRPFGVVRFGRSILPFLTGVCLPIIVFRYVVYSVYSIAAILGVSLILVRPGPTGDCPVTANGVIGLILKSTFATYPVFGAIPAGSKAA